MAEKLVKSHRIHRQDEELELDIKRSILGDNDDEVISGKYKAGDILPRQASDGDTPFLYQSDIDKAYKLGKQLIKYGFNARTEVVTKYPDTSIEDSKSYVMPEFLAIYRVPCTPIKLAIQIVPYGIKSCVAKCYRSDYIVPVEAVGDPNNDEIEVNPILEELLEIDNNSWCDPCIDGEYRTSVCTSDLELSVAINSFINDYKDLTQQAIYLAMYEMEIAVKELELAETYKIPKPEVKKQKLTK